MNTRQLSPLMTLLLPLLLTGCAPTSTSLSKDTALVSCGGIFNTLDDCVIKAREVCPGGYDVMSVNQGEGNRTLIDSDGKYSTLTGDFKRTLLVKCQ